ncbi:MAG: hypothetical protein ACOYK8_10570 [Alphaproteobacteria bacterium]
MLSDEELASLPEDPIMAFIKLESIAKAVLNQSLTDDSIQMYQHNKLCCNYMSYICSLAETYDLGILEGYQIPYSNNPNFSELFEKFSQDIDNFIIKFRVQNMRSQKEFSVSLDDATKRKIRFLIDQIKEKIGEADLEENKKNALYDKLNEFSKEVDKSRTSFGNFLVNMNLACAGLGKAAKELLPVAELVSNIIDNIRKVKEDETSQIAIAHSALKRISSPPKRITHEEKSDFDEEIPF